MITYASTKQYVGERWERIAGWCITIWQKAKSKWLPLAWRWIKRVSFWVFVIGFAVLIIWQTMRGVSAGLTNKYDNLFNVFTTTVGTVVAIFFSLALIPLNQVATRYSPRFLRFLRRDKFFWVVFICSAATLTYDAIFLLVGSSQQVAIAATELFILQVVLLGLSVLHVIKLSDPYNSILLPAHKEIVKTFRKWIPRNYAHCVKQARKNFKGQEERLTQTAVDVCHFQIDERITNYIQEELIPIREVALKAIRDLDLELAKNAIQTMMSVVVIYLYDRREYHSDNDPLLYFLYTEYKQIARSGSNELKLRLHAFLADCWRQVGVRAAVVNVKGLKRIGENFNGLVTYPVIGLKELCALNLLELDSYAPGKACDALADIGVQLMSEGYDNQAAEIVKELKTISIVADQQGIKNVTGSANYAIMRIYAAGLLNRNAGSYDPYNHPYREINKTINELLNTFLATKRTVYDNMVLSSLIGSFVDPFKGLNLSRLSEYALFFGENLTKQSLEKNLDCIESNVKSLKLALRLTGAEDDWYFANQVIENIYRVILNVLAYVNPTMAKDHILFYKRHPFTDDELLKKAQEIILGALGVLVDFIKDRGGKTLFQDEHMHVLFSLYCIILYEYKLRPNESLKELFEGTHALLVKLLSDYSALPDADSNDELYKYYRMLVAILKENGFEDLANDLVVPDFEYRHTGMFGSSESQYPHVLSMMSIDNHWWIKRPGFQVNGYYYNPIEEALKLDQLSFY